MQTGIKFCPTHPTVEMIRIFPEEPPSECMACNAEWEQEAADRDRPLWWDDASYIRYQSEDPYGDAQDELQEARYVATFYTDDYCSGGGFLPHAPHCANAPDETDVPF